MKKKDPNKYPKGWNRGVVESIIARAEAQTDGEAIAEADAAWENQRMVLMRVPTELASKVRALIDRHVGAARTRKGKSKSASRGRGTRAA